MLSETRMGGIPGKCFVAARPIDDARLALGFNQPQVHFCADMTACLTLWKL